MNIKMETITGEIEQEKKETELFIQKSKSLVITNNEEYQNVGNNLKEIKARLKKLEALRVSITAPINESLKNINNLFKVPKDNLNTAESIIKTAILKFQKEQEIKIQAEQIRLSEIARKEEEKKRLLLEQRAKKAEENGRTDKAEELRELKEDVTVKKEIAVPQVDKIEGISTMEIPKWKLINIAKVPAEYLILDEVMITKMVKATKGKIPIPGIAIFIDKVVSARI